MALPIPAYHIPAATTHAIDFQAAIALGSGFAWRHLQSWRDHGTVFLASSHGAFSNLLGAAWIHPHKVWPPPIKVCSQLVSHSPRVILAR